MCVSLSACQGVAFWSVVPPRAGDAFTALSTSVTSHPNNCLPFASLCILSEDPEGSKVRSLKIHPPLGTPRTALSRVQFTSTLHVSAPRRHRPPSPSYPAVLPPRHSPGIPTKPKLDLRQGRPRQGILLIWTEGMESPPVLRVH